MKYFSLKGLWQTNQWLMPAYVGVDEKGTIQHLSSEAPKEAIAVEAIDGFALPGFQNAHSHAFQFAMAGMAEVHPVGIDDDFWTWREAMYQCALSVSPEEVEAIATMLYAEMLRHGYTQVAEFHYLHHEKDGKPYSNVAEMGERLISAAKTAGIKITLVPVFYQQGGFGLDSQPRQRRFISKTTDDYFKLLDASSQVIKQYENASLGFSVHSLRAVNLEDIKTAFHEGPKHLPFHIHVSEQKKEVADCLAYCSQRPMQWLLENLPVDSNFHLVHSTHLDDWELEHLAKSGASVVLCPSTEGNLGDGIFRMKEYVKLGGKWSIGTDSHIGLNPFEEFRMIDYRQRLITNLRSTISGNAGGYLVNESVQSGRKAMGISTDQSFSIGKPFDALIVKASDPLLENAALENLMATIVYTANASTNLGTIVNGKWVVKNGNHKKGSQIRTSFNHHMKNIPRQI